jgi:hypothetical protein
MTLRLNGSTSGYVEIDAPAAAGSNTLVLPNGNGANGQYLQTNGSGALSWQTVATGKILQVVYADNNTSLSTTSSTYQDTNITGTITPTSANSTILIILGVHLSTVDATAYASYLIKRTVGGTSTTIYTSGGEVMFQASQYRVTHGTTYLDSPSTTSATTYTIAIRSSYGGTTVEANRGGRSTITLMEVAA